MTYREATLLIKWLENKMNYWLLWNSSKLSSGRKAETPRNQSRHSNMLSHPRKLLSSSMDGAGKIFYHPARSTQQHIKPARTVGAVRDADGASGFAACRRSDCDRNADCRQNVLHARQHRCSAGRARGAMPERKTPQRRLGFRLPRSTHTTAIRSSQRLEQFTGQMDPTLENMQHQAGAVAASSDVLAWTKIL